MFKSDLKLKITKWIRIIKSFFTLAGGEIN